MLKQYKFEEEHENWRKWIKSLQRKILLIFLVFFIFTLCYTISFFINKLFEEDYLLSLLDKALEEQCGSYAERQEGIFSIDPVPVWDARGIHCYYEYNIEDFVCFCPGATSTPRVPKNW